MALVRGSTGQVVARYSYDAWGKCTVTNASGYTVGTKNPFRYRGYYHDAEKGLYYLNSRYYSFHDLRHTFATLALQTGADVKTVSSMLGHYSAGFTLDTYTHVTTDMQKNASIIVGDFMEELFGKELKPWERNESPEKEHSD